MNKIFLCVILFCGVALAVPAQQQKPGITKADVILSKDKPTVYVSFERAGERKAVYAMESNQGIWLRLNNNTRWAINFSQESLYVGIKTTPLRLSDGRGALDYVKELDGQVLMKWKRYVAMSRYAHQMENGIKKSLLMSRLCQ